MHWNLLLASGLTGACLLMASCAPAAPQAAPNAVKTPQDAARTKPGAATPTPKALAEQPRYGGVLTQALDGDPPSLDIQQETYYSTQIPIGPCYSWLVMFDPIENDKVVPDLAERWELSPDGTVYTFHLHKGVKFHDGSPLTSEDVKFSVDRLRNPPKGIKSPRADNIRAIEKVENPDGNTVRLALTYPSASFLAQFSLHTLAVGPKKLLETKGDLRKDVVGTGAFKFKEQSPGVATEIVRNPDYFVKGRPYLDGMKVYVIKDSTTRIAALKTGRIHLLHRMQIHEVDAAKKDAPQMVTEPYQPLNNLEFHPNNSRPPWNDVRVRRAVSLATDRQAALKAVYLGAGTLGTQLAPSPWNMPQEELLKMPGYRQPKDADIVEAKKLLADAGFPNGFKMKIFSRAGEKNYEGLAVFMKDQLAKFGIQAELQLEELGKFMEITGDYGKRGYEAAARASVRYLTDPDESLQRLIPGSYMNYSDFNDDRVTDLVEKQARTLDPVKRKEIVRECERLLLELNPSIVCGYEYRYMAHWAEVRGHKAGVIYFHTVKHLDTWLTK